MTMILFCGPSLPSASQDAGPGFEILPPVRQGDLFQAARRSPAAIGIVDGYFDQVPSVWHKEILWALNRGIAVFGSSSMGALRASELHQFGMCGVGRVFEQYRDGELEDDDEVALRHGPSELGYPVVSEAMVNIRATVAAACSAGVMQAQGADILLQVAKSLFYGDRRYPEILKLAVAQGLTGDDAARFRSWLPEGRVDQKALDAAALIAEMRRWQDAGAPTPRVSFTFAHTDAWAALAETVE